MSANEIALFVAMLFAGALVLQYPIGWLSDRLDRRTIIGGVALLGALACMLGAIADSGPAWLAAYRLWPLMGAAFLAGGMTTPLYALLLAYTNDNLSIEEMPAASGGLVFTFGLGAILGPLVTGRAMQDAGPFAFWLVVGATFFAIALYAAYRMTQRAAPPVSESDAYLGVVPTASVVAVEAAGNWAAEQAEAEDR
jgi:MFS family permease